MVQLSGFGEGRSMLSFLFLTLCLSIATILPIVVLERLCPSLFFNQHSSYCNDKFFGKDNMLERSYKPPRRFNYILFMWKCLFIGMTIFGTFCFYYTVVDFNTRLTEAEQRLDDTDLKLNFAEFKVSNCYPND